MARTGFDPSATNDATPTKTVGGLYEHEGKEYRYYRNDPTIGVATEVGQVSQFSNATGQPYTVSISATGGAAAGVAVGTISGGNYGFYQVTGDCQVQLVTDAVLFGIKLGSIGGQAEQATASDAPSTYVGIQIEARSGGVGTVGLCNLRMN
jgi:hypothetical protein